MGQKHRNKVKDVNPVAAYIRCLAERIVYACGMFYQIVGQI